MFPYRVIHRIRIRYSKLQFVLQKHQKMPEYFRNFDYVQIENQIFCIMYKLYNSYFVNFGNVVILGFLDFYINLLNY